MGDWNENSLKPYMSIGFVNETPRLRPDKNCWQYLSAMKDLLSFRTVSQSVKTLGGLESPLR